MKYLTDIYVLTKKSITNSPLTSMFLIIGLVMSMLIISIGVSFVAEHINAQEQREEIQPPNGSLYSISYQGKKNFDCISELFKGIRNNTGIIINGIMVHMDESEVNEYVPVSAEWFVKDTEWHYPLSEGRYYTVEEVAQGDKVVLIGKELRKYTYKEKETEYIDIEGEKYRVIGIVGLGEELSSWDARIFMPCTVLPQHTFDEIIGSGYMSFIMYNYEGEFTVDEQYVEKNADLMFGECELLFEGEIESGDMLENLANSNEMIYTIAIVGYIATLVYAVNIAVFWLEKRKKEIAIRKAVGYKNSHIIKLLIMEMLGYSFLSCIIALIVQGGLKMIMDTVAGYTLKIYTLNIVIGVAMVLITTLITSILPIRKMLKIQPIVALKK